MPASLLLSLPRTSIQKPRSASIIWEAGPQLWSCSTSNELVMDNYHAICSVCAHYGAEVVTRESQNFGYIVASISGAKIAERRASLLAAAKSHVFTKSVITLDAQVLYNDQEPLTTRHLGWPSEPLKRSLRSDTTDSLAGVASECGVAMNVLERNSILCLEIIGPKSNVQSAHYTVHVLVDSLLGLYVLKLPIPMHIQPLVFGPRRCHLQSIFEQTGVNVYSPPSTSQLDEVYLTGDAAQLPIAKLILQELCSKTEKVVEQDLKLTSLTTEWLVDNTEASAALEAIGIRNSAHISIICNPDGRYARVRACTQESAERTITAIAGLLRAAIYTATFDDRRSLAHSRPSLDWSMAADVAARTGANISKCDLSAPKSKTAPWAISGPASIVKRALGLLCCPGQPEWAQPDWSCTLAFDVEADLRDFYAGKKNGKIAKIAASSGCQIWFTPAAEGTCGFTVRVSHVPCSQFLTAVALLEDELPAERQFFVPESFHKQVIGAGGSRIQSIMRNHNVYIKFSTNTEVAANAICRHNIDNVIIRCPAKNAARLEAASKELLQSVNHYDSEFGTTFLLLTRSQRRYLIATHGSVVAEIERRFNAVIKFPAHDTRGTELLEICAPQNASQAAARQLRLQLPVDYEFRLAYSPAFQDAVGPASNFALQVVTPLRVCFGAHVQAFSRVQMRDDSSIYSQILITMADRSGDALEEISRILTSYLRRHGLDIVDKGELNANVIVEGTAAAAALPSTSSDMAPFTSESKPVRKFAELKNWQSVQFTGSTKLECTPVKTSRASATPAQNENQNQNQTKTPVRQQTSRRIPRQPRRAQY